MATVRVFPETVGRLAMVRLTLIDVRKRRDAAARARERDWNENLDPARDLRDGEPTAPPVGERFAALGRAVELERAAASPSGRGYLVPEDKALRWAPEAVASPHGDRTEASDGRPRGGGQAGAVNGRRRRGEAAGRGQP